MTADAEATQSRSVEPWHLKREISLSLVLMSLGQLGLGVWYVSDFNAWRHETERTIARHDQAIVEGAARNQDLAREVADRLARIETKIDALTHR